MSIDDNDKNFELIDGKIGIISESI